MPPTIEGLADLVEIGRGGFGTVYRARQVDLGRAVAVKVLPDVRADSDSWARFARECQALGSLGNHPNIATVYGCGLTRDGAGYLTMELLPGGSLADRVAEGPSDWRSVATWGVALSGALETAHRAGITHRDVKPENVLFDGLGAPKLVDFGIASVPGAYRTATGAVTLTLAHASPEVVAGGRGGVPGDIYSLASTVFAALAGHAAFVAEADETMVPMLARIASAPVPDLRGDGVPDAVCSAVERGMAKDPADRPASAEAFGMALHEALAENGVMTPVPPLLLPGMQTAYAASPASPASPDPGASDAGATWSGDRTITGWDPAAAGTAAAGTAAAAAAAAAAASTAAGDADATVRVAGAAPGGERRRRANPWAAVAAVAVAALAVVAWRGIDAASRSAASAPPSSSGALSASSSTSGTASPTATTPSPSPSGGAASSSTRPTSAAPTSPGGASGTPSTSASASTTTAPVVLPSVPRTVRVLGAVPVGTSQVTVTASWAAPTTGPAPTAYDIRWAPAGGSGGATTSTSSSSSSAQQQVVAPLPASGVYYVWQVRSRTAAGASAWVTAQAVMPNLVGRRTASARASLRALGIRSSTFDVTTDVAKQVGRVLSQSVAKGTRVAAGASVSLGVGVAR